MAQPTVSAGLAAGLVRFASTQGAAAGDLYSRAGIDPVSLEDPDNRLPFARYVELMRAAQDLTSDPALALHYGEAVGMSEISIVGLLMEASATIGDAYIQMRRYGRLAMEVDVVSEGPRFELVRQDNKLFLVDRHRLTEGFRELTEGAFAWLVCGPRRYLNRSPVLSAHFAFRPPSYWREYERVLQCPVAFDAKWNALEMHPDSLNWPVAQNPTYVFGILTERADSLLTELEATRTISGQVQSLLATVLHHGDVSAEALAQRMGFSRQTLFRRLKDEGTTYTALLDDLRRRLAVEYLEGSKVSVNEIAYLLGFSDTAAFTRAFKRWTGQTPGSFRL